MKKFKRHVFDTIQIGNKHNLVSRAFDWLIVISIFLNLFTIIFSTFSQAQPYMRILKIIELITVLIFAVEYILRLWTADYLYPEKKKRKAVLAFVFSILGIIDFLSFFPYFLPFVFPKGAVAFRMFRVIRIFRLFRINTQYDAFNVIVNVLNEKKGQIFYSVCMICILIIASSLCMYSLEHEAQPEQFSNAFSGIWWAVSTLLTVGYGDIYPITTLGRIMAIIIAFLGVGLVAIPTGIISAGFVDQYTSLKQRIEQGYQLDMQFIKIHLLPEDPWVGKKIVELELPRDVIISVIKRNDQMILPHGELVLLEGDRIVLGAEPFKDHERIKLKEVVLEEQNPWTGRRIKELDIPRTSIVVLVKRGDKSLVPHGELMLEDDDKVFMYTQLHLAKTKEIEL